MRLDEAAFLKANMEQDVTNGRMPAEWRDRYVLQLEAWRNGQELPPEGTPIRGWGVISPAQQEMLTRINILTVEDLAGVNDEGLRRIGMGALDLKNKAVAWMAQLADKGPLTIEVAGLKAENASLRTSIETMSAQLKALESKIISGNQPVVSVPTTTDISADDIMPEDPRPVRMNRTK